MMSIRRQPFGYQICGGRISVNSSEADIVKYIFRAYIGGASFNDIKSSLLNQPVAYDVDKAWNKNMIARILGDRRYVGTDVYGATATAASASSGAASAGWTMATNTATTPRRWMRSRCTEPSLPL